MRHHQCHACDVRVERLGVAGCNAGAIVRFGDSDGGVVYKYIQAAIFLAGFDSGGPDTAFV